MKTRAKTRKPTLDAAAAHLRALSLSCDTGAFVGKEDDLVEQLGVARATLRQAARLIEQEGLLHVKRGANGGYFAARPSTNTIENVLGTYLDTQRLDVEETFIVGYMLWAEALSEAIHLKTPEVRAILLQFRKRLDALAPDARMFEYLSFDTDYRRSIFRLIKRPYLELFFDLNRTVTWRFFEQMPWEDGKSEPEFIDAWRDLKKQEFNAIEQSDENAAIDVAKRARTLWGERLFSAGLGLKRSL